MPRRRRLVVIAAAAVVTAVNVATSSAAPPLESSFTASVFVSTEPCPGLVTPQPYFTPFGATIAVSAEISTKTWLDPDQPAEAGRRTVRLTGTGTDLNTGAEYIVHFAGDGPAGPDVIGQGTLLVIRKGGGGMVATAELVIHGDWSLFNNDARCVGRSALFS